MNTIKTLKSYALYILLCLVFLQSCSNVKVEQKVNFMTCPKGSYFITTYVWYKPESSFFLKEIVYSSYESSNVYNLDSIKKAELKKAIKYKQALENGLKH
jgi:hypothetical protein